EDLRKRLEVVEDEDDDVFIEATPLASKVLVVDYQIILVDNKPRYPLSRFTLEQLVNVTRLQVEEESEMSLELLRAKDPLSKGPPQTISHNDLGNKPLPISFLESVKMFNQSEDIQATASDTRPPMLDRIDFESWQQRIWLYCKGKDHGGYILQSIDEGPFKMRRCRDKITSGTDGPYLGPERDYVVAELS
nr:integrase, catalytic region, zinc finger, CCHC-type, peptidase aspartic, catalytic [Tanacetum cinerariifolium]